MLLPKHKDAGGWKSTASSRLPARKQMVSFLTRTRLTYVLVLGAVLLFWRIIGGGGRGMDRFYCWGPPAAPMDLSANDRVAWHQHLQTPVLFNHHVPIEVQSKSIQHLDLNKVKSTPKALSNQERILILTPLKDASPHLAKYFELIADLTYPHHLIDLAFLVGDSSDDTMGVLSKELDRLQSRSGDVPFNSAMVVEKDFHFTLSQDVKERHGYKAQGPRRKAMGKARNYLLSTALKPEHSWVYWRDVDIVESPESILEDLIAHDVDIVVPNIWFHRYENGVDIEGRFDYNSWVESAKGLKLAAKLPKDTIIAEGYKEFKTGRTHMALMGDRSKNKDEELNLDGIGGVSILVKGDVHRSGINFPCYAFENQAETEGFAKMAKRAGYRVVGLPNYVVWHIDTAEEAGNA